jgi:hypothetical protein
MKISFHNLRDAINYHLYCPLCQDKMLINDRYVEIRKDWYDDQHCIKFVWTVNDTEIIVDLDTNQFDMNSKYYRPDYGVGEYVGTSPKYSYNPHNCTINGILYSGLGLNCGGCKQYHYVIKLVGVLETRLLTKIELNSETITVMDDSVVHEIKNIYSTGITDYRTIDQEDVKTISLPLITINFNNPWKTIDRLKTLTLFS